jgi:hypothetical protein
MLGVRMYSGSTFSGPTLHESWADAIRPYNRWFIV